MGSGRVEAFQSARARSVAWPGSLSFGFAPTPTDWSAVRSFQVKNFDNKPHSYTVTGEDRYSDFDPDMTLLRFSLDGAASGFGASKTFTLNGGQQRRVWTRLTLDPSFISEFEQEYGWYYFFASMDGSVKIAQSGGNQSDTLRLPWQVAPLTTSASVQGRRKSLWDKQLPTLTQSLSRPN
jgi:hypothetical protein